MDHLVGIRVEGVPISVQGFNYVWYLERQSRDLCARTTHSFLLEWKPLDVSAI